MARYQAAVSRGDCRSFSANIMEESRMCTVPGGLARVKKQFEKDKIASSCNTLSQYQYQHEKRSEQEVIHSSQVDISRSSQAMERIEQEASKAHKSDVLGTEMASHLEKHTEERSQASQFHQYVQETVIDTAEDEEIPKVSAKFLKEQFEKSAQEKLLYSDKEMTPAKQIKIISESEETLKPSSVVSTSSTSCTSTSQRKETSSTKHSDHGASSSTLVQVNATPMGKTEEFPPPPPDIFQTPVDVTAFSQSPECPNPPRIPLVPKELYSKQRNLYELNRLYKHIHPELRKNLEKDYISEVSEIVSSQVNSGSSVSADVQQARYVFENTNDSSQKTLNSEREHLEWDEILKGEVQSMRWIFENQPLDSINNGSPDEDNINKGIAGQEIIAGGDVKYTTWMFETQPIDTLGDHSSGTEENAEKIPELARGDVRTARWMFETKPLDSMNKMHQEESMVTATKDITGGDVKTVRYMFETQHLDQLGQLHSVDEVHLLQLRSELKEIKGNVKRSIKCFETQPLYVIRDGLGQMLEIKTVHREDVEKGDVRTARWMFETQPLDTINKDITEIKVVRGISMEENVKGGVSRAKWLFETQPLEKIKEESEEVIIEKETIIGTDVSRKCWMFETQPLDILKDVPDTEPLRSEEIIGGDVQTTKHLFETLPIEALKDSPDVGKLQKITASEEEKGDVRHQKWIFETQPLEDIREDKKEYIRTVKLEEVDRGNVKNFTHIFESNNLIKFDASHKIEVEGVTRGAVELNKSLFETTPLYAIQDHLGKYHQVKTVQQEEILRGDVRSCRWLFETRPIDQFDESIHKFQIIRGISAQEIQTGNVKSAKWLFETQPLDSIKYFSNMEEVESKTEQVTDIVKGDVKTCRWLFETQPMESLYEKVSLMTGSEEIHKGDVKACTWLFETKPLDTIKDDSEATTKLQTVKQEEIQGGDVRTACFLFETENLDSIQGEEGKEIKAVEMDIQAGDVSSMRHKFENQPLDSISSSSEEVLKKIKALKTEDIQKGNVLNCRWLFENQPIDMIKENHEGDELVKTVTDVQGGDVRKGCFIFETFSLDEIKEESDCISTKKTITEEVMKGDVKSYRMLFETQPLYAIQDREGYYHEVTTVKKEEVIHGDVRGTRWLFETKPLDSINQSETVYVIKSVTQEDIQKGDVSSVRYRFETQPLDQISEESRDAMPTVDYIQGGDVKAGRQFFESENSGKNTYVRTVSVSEIQKGNVKTSTWLFETHTIDELRGEGSEYENIKTVTQEDMQKGDVKQAVWLFENQTLDSIREADESTTKVIKEEIPPSDVKTTTWLFETTPLHEFNESRVEKIEIIGKSIKETLEELYSQKVIEAPGIIIEAGEVGDVRMAKYKLMNQASPEIQKEEIIRVDLRNIIMNLLSKRDCTRREIWVSEEEKGNINLTKTQLLNRSTEFHAEKEEIVSGDVQQAIKNLFSEDRSVKKGILIQEDERGDVNMTIYCLLHENTGDTIKREEVIGGDVKRTIHNLLSSISNNKISERAKIDASERGNVQFFTTCIETGALDYLKQLQEGSNETLTARKQEGEEEIIGGDVEGTKLLLKKRQSQVGRTVNEADIIPGDVQNTVKVFMTEPQTTFCKTPKEEIIKGDLQSTLNSLSQAINQKTVAKTEETIKGDMLTTLKSLRESSHQWRESKQPNAIPGDIEKAIECLEKTASTRTEILKKELIRDDLEISLRNLKEAQRAFKEVDKKGVMKEDVKSVMGGSSEEQKMIHQLAVQRDTKSVLQPRPGPFEPVARWQGGADQTTGKSCHGNLIEKRTEVTLPKAPKGTVKIVIDREQNNDALEKSLRRLSNSHHNAIKNVLESGDKMGVRIDTTTEQHRSDEHMSRQLTSTVSAKEYLKTEESETVREQKDAVFHSTQSIDKRVGRQQTQTCKVRNDHQKTEPFSVKSPRSTPNLKIPTDTQSPRPIPTQGPVNKTVGKTYEVSEDFQKQTLLKQEIQCSHKDMKKKNMNPQPTLPVEQDIANITEVKVSPKSHSKFKATDKKQADVHLRSQDFLMKTNTSADLKMAMEMSLNSTNCNPENNVEESECSLPPPSPPPPPPSNASSEIEFPLPPPPPLMMLPEKNGFPPSLSPEMIKAEFESFPGLPLPPPPEDEKSERDCLSAFPTPLPPPTPSRKPALLLSSSVQEKHTGTFIQHSQEEAFSSQQTHSQAKVLKGKSGVLLPPPTLPKPKFPKQREDKKNHSSPKVELENFLPGVECKITPSTDQKRVVLAASSEHTEVKQSTSRSLDERKQLSMDSMRSLSQTVPETSLPREKTMAPLLKSHSFSAGSGPQSPKPYMRKFKTPLMIAEEKYRQQREELERQKHESSCYNTVKTESPNQNRSVLQKTKEEAPLPGTESGVTLVQPNPNPQSHSQVPGVCTDDQLSTTGPVTAAAKGLQHVSAASEDKAVMKKEVLRSSREVSRSISARGAKQEHRECSTQRTQHQGLEEQLHLPPRKPVSPSFKVKTIELPTADHKCNERDRTYESCKKQPDCDVQTISKEQHQKTEKTETSTEYSHKQSAAEKYYHLPKKEKRVTITLPTDPPGKSHGSKLRIVPEKQREFRESASGKPPGSERTDQEPAAMGPEEERLRAERKQGHLNKSAQKVVKQKVTDVQLDSQTRNFQQTQTSESQVERITAPQPSNNLQEEKGLEVKGIQQKQVFSHNKDSKQEITANKSLFSSAKESQQDDGKRALNILESVRKREELQQILSRVQQLEAEPGKGGLEAFQTLLKVMPGWLLSEEKRRRGVCIAAENNLEKIKEEVTQIKTQVEGMLVSCESTIQGAMVSSRAEEQGSQPPGLRGTSSWGDGAAAQLHVPAAQPHVPAAVSHVPAAQPHVPAAQPHVPTAESHVPAAQPHVPAAQPHVPTAESHVPTAESHVPAAQPHVPAAQPHVPAAVSHVPAAQPHVPTAESHVPAAQPHVPTAQLHVPAHPDGPADHSQGPAGSLKTRPKSPAFITIESSARRPRSPPGDQLPRVPKAHGSAEPPAPGAASAAPSPPPPAPAPVPEGRSEQLAKLRDATARLAAGAAPCPAAAPAARAERRSEIIPSPASLRRQIKIETRARDAAPSITIPISVAFGGASAGAQGQVRRGEEGAACVHLDAGPGRAEAQCAGRAAGRPPGDLGREAHGWLREWEAGAAFAAASGGRLDTNGEADHGIQQESHSFCKEEFGWTSLENTRFAGFSCGGPRELRGSGPAVRSPREQLPGAEARERQAGGPSVGPSAGPSASRSPGAAGCGLDFKHAPPTYEDVLAGHSLDLADSPKELRSKLQKAWQESEDVFQSLGFATSDAPATETRATFHLAEASAWRREAATPRQGNMYTLSKDCLSNGVPSSRQAEFS
ncbi:xin actin-binding repeat-containing protein 2-like isoform 1-T1 [Lycaon pictus]